MSEVHSSLEGEPLSAQVIGRPEYGVFVLNSDCCFGYCADGQSVEDDGLIFVSSDAPGSAGTCGAPFLECEADETQQGQSGYSTSEHSEEVRTVHVSVSEEERP